MSPTDTNLPVVLPKTEAKASPLTLGLVGMHFWPPAKSLLQCLAAGHPLRLRREPSNPYDPLAIMVVLRTGTLSPEHLDAIDILCSEQGHDRNSIGACFEWHLGYVAAKQPKNGSWNPLAGTVAPQMEPEADYLGALCFSPDGAPGVRTSLTQLEPDLDDADCDLDDGEAEDDAFLDTDDQGDLS